MKAYGVAARRLSTLAGCVALLVLQSAPLAAQEIYRWVDENGVVNFSDRAPPAATANASSLTLQDSQPDNYDPEQDIYNLEATAQRMQALRDELAAEREARRARPTAQPPVVVQYPEQRHYGYPYDYPYGYPRPPGGQPGKPPNRPRPEPPAPEDDTATWRPPGQSGDRGGRPAQFRQ
jgi:hypothetical protein